MWISHRRCPCAEFSRWYRSSPGVVAGQNVHPRRGRAGCGLSFEEPNLIIGLSFWQDEATARRLFKGALEIGPGADTVPSSSARLTVEPDTEMVDELFPAAKLLNPRPTRTSQPGQVPLFTLFI